MIWIALLLAGGYLFVLFATGYVWSIVGGVLAIALVATALMGGGGAKRADAI